MTKTTKHFTETTEFFVIPLVGVIIEIVALAYIFLYLPAPI
jgi:hypothetical protein